MQKDYRAVFYFYKLEARTQDGVVVFSKSKKMIYCQSNIETSTFVKLITQRRNYEK